MKTLKTMKKLPLLLAVAFLSFSCSNDDDNNNPMVEPQELNIVETAQATADLSILVDAVVQAGLVDALTATGNKTVLAPTNAAFTTFLADKGFNSLSEVPNDVLTQILLNHVIAGSNITSTDLAGTAGYTSTLADGPNSTKMSIYYNGTSGVTFNGVASVAIPDVETSNGLVHVIDAVIDLPNIVTFATADPNFSTLVSALTELTPSTDFVSVLQGEGPFTVLAPVNEAFAALPAIPGEDDLTQILLNHVVGGAISSTDLAGLGSGYANTLATGPGDNYLSLYFDATDGVSFNGAANVAVADVVASNGIIHAIDGVITLPTIATFATSNPALSILVDALAYADTGMPTVPYIDTVSDATAGPFTVFAPTNDAFVDVLGELNLTALTDLTTDQVDTVLLYHIVGANVQSSGLPNGTVAALGGNLTADNTAFTLTDPNDRVSNIVTSLVDIQGINGVVHVIDKVILFPLN